MTNIYSLNSIESKEVYRETTGIDSLDLLLSGGIVSGSTVLASGTTGAGKSTIFLQIAHHLAEHLGKKVLYLSAEENKEQIKIRANRMLINSSNIYLTEDPEINHLVETLQGSQPNFVIIDSLQMLYSNKIKQAPMTPTQMKNGLLTLSKYAKDNRITMVFIGHATKGGFIAGLQTLQHMVDTVFFMETDEETGTRSLEIKKNRFGQSQIFWRYLMTENGIHDDPTNYTNNPFFTANYLNLKRVQEIIQNHSIRGYFAKLSLNWLKKQGFTSISTSSEEFQEILDGNPVWKPIVINSLNWLEKEIGKYENT